MVLSGQRHKQLQETIIATEVACALLDEDTTQVREKVCYYGSSVVDRGFHCLCVYMCVSDTVSKPHLSPHRSSPQCEWAPSRE